MKANENPLSIISSKLTDISQLRDEQSREIRTWSTVPRNESAGNYFSDNLNLISEEENPQPPEARAWSSGLTTSSENFLTEGPTRKQRVLLSTTSEEEQQQESLRKDPRGVEQILSYIDRHRPPRKKKYRLTWRTFIGTMSGMDQIYNQDDFLRDYRIFQPVVVFTDSVFRGISQVMFANNPLSGIIITIGLFIGNWQLALYGLLGTTVSTLTAHILGFNYSSIRSGLFGYNGCLTAMGIAYFTFSDSPQMIAPVVIMSIFSSIFAMAIGKVLVQRLELSPFTFSFQISTWIWLLGALKFRYFFVDGTIISPGLLKTLVIKPDLLNVTFPGYTVQDNFVGFFASISQVYFVENPYTGAIILVGVCLCSRILSLFALFGAVTSQLTAAYLLGLPPSSIHAGLWGFNSVLTCEALGGMFFVLYGYRIWLFTLYGSIMTVLLQSAVSAFLSPLGMPTLTFPFTLICWIFCLIAGSKKLIAVKVTAVSIPEDHYRRFRISQLIKSQFKILNHLTNLSLSSDESLTWEELSKIKAEFLPILMSSYVYIDDLSNLKMLVKQEANIYSTDQNYRSPLHISVSQGNAKISKWLIEHCKMNINLIDKFGNTPLFDALWNGHFHLLPYLYSRDARLPAGKSKELAFYLNAFIYEGNLDAIQCFISCGFNPNTGDYDGKNALHLAVLTNRLDIVSYFVEKTRVWFDITDHFHQTALNYALRLPDETIANYILDKMNNKHNPLDISPEKLTSLLFILETNQQIKKQEEEEECVTKTIDEILLPSLFWIIAAQNDTKKISHFIEQFPHLNALECLDYDSRSIAHVAAAQGRLKTIHFLSELCDKSHFCQLINREDRWNLSPLDEAYQNGHFHICHFINEFINKDEFKHLPFSSNQKFNDKNNIVYLLRKWNKIHLFLKLATSGEAERIHSLFYRNYFNSNELYADYHGRTPMHLAAANGHINVVKILIQHGYGGMTHKDRWGNYPIDEARRNNFNEIVQELERVYLETIFR